MTATIKAKDGDTFQFWWVAAFSESVLSELLRLGDADALSVQGPLKVETYEKNGETKLSLSLIADRVLALHQPREKTPHRECPAGANRDFDDAIPY